MKKIICLVLTLTLMFTLITYADTTNNVQPDVQPFTDIKGHWAEADIMKLYNMGIITGSVGGKFEPNRLITNMEFIIMMDRAMGYEIVNDDSIPDLPKGWERPWLVTALKNNLVNITEVSTFYMPNFINYPMDRYFMGKLMVRALGKYDPFANLDTEKMMTDEYVIPEARQFEGEYVPNTRVTRADAANAIVRFLEYKENPEAFKAKMKKQVEDSKNDINDAAKVEQAWKRVHEGSFTLQDLALVRDSEMAKQKASKDYIMHPIFWVVYSPDNSLSCQIYILNGVDYEKGSQIKTDYVSPSYLNVRYGLTISGGLQKVIVNTWRDINMYHWNHGFSSVSKEYRCPDDVKKTITPIKNGDIIKHQVTIKRGNKTQTYMIEVKIQDGKWESYNY